ncbi:MAG TPA: hypothetical protein VNT20_20405 [Flavisolibacter sp.]|jgi:hypothetical protein|nr:hypothetical protein [Flavisolibacter sp.]
MGSENKYNEFIRKIILAEKEHRFTEVNELESVKYLRFNYEEYLTIKQLVKNNNWQQINAPQEPAGSFREYLEIVLFKDQNMMPFIAAIYDSDALEQDPQIIDIFPC